MANTFEAKFLGYINWRWVAGYNTFNELKGRVQYEEDLTFGTASGQAETGWAWQDSLADAETDTLDLTDLSVEDWGGTLSVNFVAVKGLIIVNEATDGSILTIGGAAANEWSAPFGADGDKLVIPSDSLVLLTNKQCGWDVDASNKNFKLAASGGTVSYQIGLVGLENFPSLTCSSST